MYLLIVVKSVSLAAYKIFTSHYVSINSSETFISAPFNLHLHPTMYLLIAILQPEVSSGSSFTSHYVSINWVIVSGIWEISMHLHPTMYLLILWGVLLPLLLLYLHPTMYLLILFPSSQPLLFRWFTSHYVSINFNRDIIFISIY